jgi:hypothetical protein
MFPVRLEQERGKEVGGEREEQNVDDSCDVNSVGHTNPTSSRRSSRMASKQSSSPILAAFSQSISDTEETESETHTANRVENNNDAQVSTRSQGSQATPEVRRNDQSDDRIKFHQTRKQEPASCGMPRLCLSWLCLQLDSNRSCFTPAFTSVDHEEENL